MARVLSMPQRTTSASVLSTVKLARWQWRQTWRLLLVTGFGMLAAVTLVCAVPLYSRVAQTAELRGFLAATPPALQLASSEILVDSMSDQIAINPVHDVQKQLNAEFQSTLGSYLSGPPTFSVLMGGGLLTGDAHHGFQLTGNVIELQGNSMKDAPPHAKLFEGRLPRPLSSDLEVALSKEAADSLSIHAGSVIMAQVFSEPVSVCTPPPPCPSSTPFSQLIMPLHVVGIFMPPTSSDVFWHGENFENSLTSSENFIYKGLISNDTYLSLFSKVTTTGQLAFSSTPELRWYYHLDSSRIDINNLDDVKNRLHTVLSDISGSETDGPFVNAPYVFNTKATSSAAAGIDTYTNRISVAQIPIMSLSFLVAGLLVFFVSMMTELLVDRQRDGIAILRSRGASRRQIIGSLTTQGAVLGLLAILIGSLLAIGLVYVLARSMWSMMDQQSLNVISNQPVPVAQTLAIYGSLTVLIALGAMVFSIARATNQGIVSRRHGLSRATKRPIWQRLSVDIVAAIIAITCFAGSLYVTSPGVLDVKVRVLVLPPLTLGGVIFLLIGLTLLFLRFFPLLLDGMARLGSWSRRATPMLALAQMVRAPQQSLRMTMLLAFAIAFAMFALIFTTTQAQRIADVASYQVGADFSGTVPGLGSVVTSGTYAKIPGVTSATVGDTEILHAAQSNGNASVEIQAVDANTYANTMIWKDTYSSQSITSLMKQLVEKRITTIVSAPVPVIVDSIAMGTLNLSIGSHITLTDLNKSISVECVVIAAVNRIPTINDSSDATGANTDLTSGGFLMDYQSYVNVFQAVNYRAVSTNTVWLRTKDDAASLTSVRAALNSNSLQLDNLNDRRAIEFNLSHDPLYLDLIGVLLLSAVVAMLLALLGNLIASWLNVRSRLINFAVLRALGTAPHQIASIITWEQVIIYATSLIIGVIFGLLLALLALPSLVFTNIAISGLHSDITNGEFFLLQNVPAVHVIYPNTLFIAFGVLVLICVIVLSMMMRLASQPAMSQTLRLNED